MSDVLHIEQLHKVYGSGAIAQEVLHGINLRLESGEFVALIGPSGSGKSTLLNMMGLLEFPTSGRLLIGGIDTHGLSDHERTALRGRHIGFVFQFHHLISSFTVLENVMLPLLIRHRRLSVAMQDHARQLLAEVGLSGLEDRRPQDLSGGQQQRVAVIRALVLAPPLVLADEPTGNLDTRSAEDIFSLMRRINGTQHTTCLIVTHDQRLADRCDRQVRLVDGRIVEDQRINLPEQASRTQ